MADNGLRFQIRHGNGNPASNLKQYELGYDYTNKKFYIGTGTSTSPSSEEIKYLHLTGGTLTSSVHIRPTTTTDYKVFSVSRQMNFTDDTNYYVNAMSITRDTDNKLVRGALILYRKSSLEGIINDSNIISSLKIGLDTEGVSNAWVSGKLLLNSSNYSNYALPKSGGILTGNLTVEKAEENGAIYLEGSTGLTVSLLIGSGYENHGVYSSGYYNSTSKEYTSSGKWLVYRDKEGKVILNGTASNATNATNDSEGEQITTKYLKLVGGTLSGNIVISKTSASGGMLSIKTDSGIDLRNAISSSTKGRHGLWSSGYSTDGTSTNYVVSNQWLIYREQNGDIRLNPNTKIIVNTDILLQGADTSIRMAASDGNTYPVLYNVKNSNQNIQLNSTGGEIFIGWANTTGIRIGCTTNCPIRLGTGAYGKTLPSTGLEGQIFFKLES